MKPFILLALLAGSAFAAGCLKMQRLETYYQCLTCGTTGKPGQYCHGRLMEMRHRPAN